MNKKYLLLLAIAAFSLGCWLLAPYFGAATYSPQIHNLRLPRATLAWLTGGSLAVAGLLMQSLLRNDLATPFTLGVASSASFGAFLCFAFPTIVSSIWAPQLLGFAFSALTLLLILRLTKSKLGNNGILLVGITINFIFGAALMIVRHLAPPYRVTKLEHWLMGSIETSSYDSSIVIAIVATLCLVIAWRLRNDLDQYGFDATVAAARGVNVPRLIQKGLLISGLLTAAVVTQCGPIAFIGLVIPHALRPFFSSSHRLMIPACWLLGSGFLVAADTLARSLLIFGLSSDIPVGILTSLIGGPAFLLIILQKTTKRSH
ncbi:MAG: iron complex transport system permease protein [Myxococcota bacterium]|jgi:iron complex transport system permease protein